MKVVVLLAGKGRRIEKLGLIHKSLIELEGKSLLSYLIQNIEKAGVDEIIPIVGYNGEAVLNEINNVKKSAMVYPVWNREYNETNNLYSLYQAKEIVNDEEFISINGDMIFDYHILKNIMQSNASSIAVDDLHCKQLIDSPGVIIKDGRIADLGRYITEKERNGYAVGIYKYGKDIVREFFDLSAKMLEENQEYGFHDPLRILFAKYIITACTVQNYSWTDIDEEGDIAKALDVLKAIQ